MEFDEEISKMTVPEIVDLIAALTEQIDRCAQELEVRAMQTSK